MVTERLAFGNTPLEATIENVYVSAAVGVPDSTPPAERERPGGSSAGSATVKVIAFGTPPARNVCA
jgi:hypothetical protein